MSMGRLKNLHGRPFGEFDPWTFPLRHGRRRPTIVRPRVCIVREVKIHPRRTYRPVAGGNCADREAVWRATRGERAIRRQTNSIRPCCLASHRWTGEAPTRANGKPLTLMVGVKAMTGAVRWLEAESLEGEAHEVERPAREQGGASPPRRGQSPHSSVEAG
jgi:hypothetical protein